MSHVFKARALLYAQRWAVIDPKSALALQHRAYAFALVGMHGEALKDLEAATALATKTASQPQPPAWTSLLEAYCRCDYKKLLQLQAAEESLPVVSLLCFLAHEQEGSHNLAVKVGMIVMEDLGGL